MDELISATDANREFSKILGRVREGQSFIVTSHGKAFAKITPLWEGENTRARAVARASLLARLKSQPAAHAGKWSREDLYEDDK